MEDIDVIKDYLVELSSFFKAYIPHEVQNYGKDVVYKNYLNELNCSRFTHHGLRPMVTTGYRYKHSLSEVIFLVKEYYTEEEQNIKLQEIIDLHNSNIEFEKLNPPVEIQSKSRNITKRKKPKQSKIDFGEDEKITKSSKSIKAAVKMAKLNKLTFNTISTK